MSSRNPKLVDHFKFNKEESKQSLEYDNNLFSTIPRKQNRNQISTIRTTHAGPSLIADTDLRVSRERDGTIGDSQNDTIQNTAYNRLRSDLRTREHIKIDSQENGDNFRSSIHKAPSLRNRKLAWDNDHHLNEELNGLANANRFSTNFILSRKNRTFLASRNMIATPQLEDSKEIDANEEERETNYVTKKSKEESKELMIDDPMNHILPYEDLEREDKSTKPPPATYQSSTNMMKGIQTHVQPDKHQSFIASSNFNRRLNSEIGLLVRSTDQNLEDQEISMNDEEFQEDQIERLL